MTFLLIYTKDTFIHKWKGTAYSILITLCSALPTTGEQNAAAKGLRWAAFCARGREGICLLAIDNEGQEEMSKEYQC